MDLLQWPSKLQLTQRDTNQTLAVDSLCSSAATMLGKLLLPRVKQMLTDYVKPECLNEQSLHSSFLDGMPTHPPTHFSVVQPHKTCSRFVACNCCFNLGMHIWLAQA